MLRSNARKVKESCKKIAKKFAWKGSLLEFLIKKCKFVYFFTQKLCQGG